MNLKYSTTTKSQTPVYSSNQPSFSINPSQQHYPQPPNYHTSYPQQTHTFNHSQNHISPNHSQIPQSPKVNRSYDHPVTVDRKDSRLIHQSNVPCDSRISKKGQNKIEFYQQVTYKITPAQQDKLALDVRTTDGEDQEDEKGNLILYDYHGGPNQNFYFKKVSQNQFYSKYNIINAATGFTLEVPNDSHDSIQLHMDPRNNGESEIWEVLPYPGGLFKIRSFCGKVLEADSTFLRNGTKVIQQVQKKQRKQLWKIIPC